MFPVWTSRSIHLAKFYPSFYSTEYAAPPAYPVILNFPQKAFSRQCYLNGEIKVNRAGGEGITRWKRAQGGRENRSKIPSCRLRAHLSQVRMSTQCYSLATSPADVWFTRKDGWRMVRASYLYMPHRPSPNLARSGSCELACKVFSSIREHQTDYVSQDLAYCFPF